MFLVIRLGLYSKVGRFSSLSRNIAANATTTAIMAVFQMLSVPVLLHYWGVPMYGEWITLNSVTAYFQVTDAGLNTATANDLTFCYVNGQHARCTALINNNAIFVCFTFALLLLVLTGLIVTGTFTALFRFAVIPPAQLHACLMLLFAQVFVGTLNNLLSGIYRATDAFARGVMIDNAIRASEYVTLLLGVVSGFELQAILALALAAKITGLVLKHFDAQRLYPFRVSVRYLDYAELRRMFAPAMSFFLLPISNAISLQGPIVLVNFFLGGPAVVIFSTTRTLTSVARSAIDILHRSAWPELSLAHGRNDTDSMRRLHRQTIMSSVAVAVLACLCLLAIGERFYRLWTADRLPFEPVLFYLLLVCMVVNVVWSSSSIVLQSTNNHTVFSLLFLSGAVLSLMLSLGILWYSREVAYLPLAQLVVDFLMLAFVVSRALTLTSDSPTELADDLAGAVRTRLSAIIRSRT